MARGGEISADVEKELVDLESRMVSLDVFSSTLQRFLSAGKIAPVVAKKIEDEFKWQKAQMGPADTIKEMLQNAEAAAYQEISDLLNAGKISIEVATQLREMIQKRVSMEEFTNTVNTLVQQKKLAPEIAPLKIADYRAVLGMLEVDRSLRNLQANNASARRIRNELKRLVQLGALSRIKLLC